jgi:recombination protein RecA
MEAVSTGSIAVDDITGIRGFPRGRLSEVFGWEGSGKTILCMSACAWVQRQGGTAIYIDVEQGLDLALAKKVGFNVEDDKTGIYLTPNTFEDTVKIVSELSKSDEADIIVVDSVAAMVPEKEMEGNVEETGEIGARARLLATTLPRLTKTLKRSALVFVNQMRANIETGWGVKFAPKERSAGGSALRHYASLRLNLKQIKQGVTTAKMTDRYTGREIEQKTSSLHEAEAFKNKCAVPYRRAAFYIRYDPVRDLWGIDNLQTICDMAVNDGVVQKKGSYFAFKEGDLNFTLQGGDAYYDHVRANPDVQAAIQARLNL